MKVFIVGHKGWIGQMYIKLFEQNNIEWTYSDNRGESDEILTDIVNSGCTHVLCVMGRTHGNLNGVQFNTIDYLQHNETLHQNINDNLFVPLRLGLFLKSYPNIHLTYIGTGCIYSYDDNHIENTETPIGDEDKPNFFGSNYSIVKGFTNELLKFTNTLTLKIRMPITSENNPRNFITKITKYEKICSISNSMTVLDELIPISLDMMKKRKIGMYNFTNPGYISHNEILQMYKMIVDPNFTWKNFTLEEQDKVLKSERSNNYLSTKKLEKEYIVNNIRTAIKNVLLKYKIN